MQGRPTQIHTLSTTHNFENAETRPNPPRGDSFCGNIAQTQKKMNKLKVFPLCKTYVPHQTLNCVITPATPHQSNQAHASQSKDLLRVLACTPCHLPPTPHHQKCANVLCVWLHPYVRVCSSWPARFVSAHKKKATQKRSAAGWVRSCFCVPIMLGLKCVCVWLPPYLCNRWTWERPLGLCINLLAST